MQKLAVKPTEINYGFLAPNVDLNQLAAKGVKISAPPKDANAESSDEGLEFIAGEE